MNIFHYLENLFVESMKVGVLLNSTAGVCLLTVCLKAAGIPITRHDCAFTFPLLMAQRSSPVITLVIAINMRKL